MSCCIWLNMDELACFNSQQLHEFIIVHPNGRGSMLTLETRFDNQYWGNAVLHIYIYIYISFCQTKWLRIQWVFSVWVFLLQTQWFFFFFFFFAKICKIFYIHISIHGTSRWQKKIGDSQIWLNWLMDDLHLGYI
jgi:hypothetical protein